MEPPARRSLLLISVLVLLVQGSYGSTENDHSTEVARYECPTGCSCIVVQETNALPYEHAKCLSIEDLRGKQLPIQSLDLSNVGLERLSSQLEKLKNLTKLNLSNNRLSEVGRLNRRIRDLNLSQNRIVSGKLGKLPQFVQKLNLSNNEITVLSLEFMKFEQLNHLELAGNPLNCSCDTLKVRNWLGSRNVWSDEVIKCSYPLKYKGRPWLQVKQSDVCEPDVQTEKNIWDEDSDNELMMGDAPAASGSGEKEDEQIEENYMPYSHDHEEDHTDHSEVSHDDGSGDDDGEQITETHRHVADEVEVEGSGMAHVPLLRDISDSPVSSATPDEEEYDEGSGAGVFAPEIRIQNEHSLGAAPSSDFASHDDHLVESNPIDEPAEESTPVTLSLGIFGKDLPAKVEDATKGPSADSEAVSGSDVSPTAGKSGLDVPTQETKGNLQDIERTDKADSKKLYILLAIIMIVMVSLIVYVAINQRRKSRSNNRRGQADVENAKETELLDMNKRLIGKPMEKNGNGENAPLMPQRDRTDHAKPVNGNNNNNDEKDSSAFNPYQQPQTPGPVYEPLLQQSDRRPHDEEKAPSNLNSFKPEEKNSSKGSLYENEDDPNNNNFKPITNGYNPYQNGVSPSPTTGSPEVHKRKDQDTWDKHTPKSPTLKRYSPVYSPETGRVKIKLTETPQPKTPLLVTRSRSNAGYITTPNLSQRS